MLMKSQSELSKELDLKKFLHRQRLQSVAILGLLNGRQSFFVDKMSQMFIRESSNHSLTSSDEELDDLQRNKLDYVK